MALSAPSLDRVTKDFDSILARLRNLIRSVFPDWTEESVANFGNMLVEINAHTGDVLTYYQDRQAGESNIVTARLRRSMIALARRLNFSPKGASAAVGQVTFTLAAPPVGSVTIQKGDTFRTLDATDPVVFQALADVTIAAGQDPPAIVFDAEN
ncbi:MAG: t4-like baseplate wedge, partial [Thermoplasmata archaeon]|nr:t4-like baseplate wedge [Thermoplasmata archaeon]